MPAVSLSSISTGTAVTAAVSVTVGFIASQLGRVLDHRRENATRFHAERLDAATQLMAVCENILNRSDDGDKASLATAYNLAAQRADLLYPPNIRQIIDDLAPEVVACLDSRSKDNVEALSARMRTLVAACRKVLGQND
jgi:hypothetical protein